MKKTTRIVLADDHELIRQGLKHIIEFEDHLKVVGEANNGEEAISLTKTLQPDLLIVDMNMPNLTGVEVLSMLRESGNLVKVIILTVEDHRDVIEKCMLLGADGYILKDSAGTEIVRAIEQVIMGEKYIDPALIGLLFNSLKERNTRQNPFRDLTERELDILHEMMSGKTNRQIGETLYIAEKTVKNYTTTIFRKLDVKDRVNAVLYAIENQLDQYRSGQGMIEYILLISLIALFLIAALLILGSSVSNFFLNVSNQL
jgi:DNA-binding NarL/FixJ family response regulator/Flp pilus assembly pilin Flp